MFDAHCHLQDERFDACREAVVAAALTAGVTGACCCGSSVRDWQKVWRLSAERGARNAELGTVPPVSPATPALHTAAALRTPHSAFHILPAFGVHPWYVGNLPTDWRARLEELLVNHPAAPVGEIGLDGVRDDLPRDLQRQVLLAQLEMAVRLRRPVVCHGARAWGEWLETLRPFAPRIPGFVAHAFGGSEDILREIVALGGFVSFAGSVCNPAAKRVRAAAATAPAERLLIETDSPDLLPGVRGSEVQWFSGSAIDNPASCIPHPALSIPQELNHPGNLPLVAQAVAELRGAAPKEIASVTEANARRVYGII